MPLFQDGWPTFDDYVSLTLPDGTPFSVRLATPTPWRPACVTQARFAIPDDNVRRLPSAAVPSVLVHFGARIRALRHYAAGAAGR